jgi:hypothetical protein
MGEWGEGGGLGCQYDGEGGGGGIEILVRLNGGR